MEVCWSEAASMMCCFSILSRKFSSMGSRGLVGMRVLRASVSLCHVVRVLGEMG